MCPSDDERGISMPLIMQDRALFLKIYEILNDYYGDLHWWPSNSPFEVIVGAILTQNTAWKNVEKAIGRLKSEGLLHPAKLLHANDAQLAELIRPSGYYWIKTKRLKAFLYFLDREYKGNLDIFLAEDLWTARKKLLSIHGIGEETADSILLYAAGKPIFVVDAYTRRIMQRHQLIDENLRYSEIQSLFITNPLRETIFYNQYHALLVNVGKQFCRKRNPKCEICPLQSLH